MLEYKVLSEWLTPLSLAILIIAQVLRDYKKDKKIDAKDIVINLKLEQVATVAKETALEASIKVDQVAEVAARAVAQSQIQQKEILEKATDIHTLVNGQYSAALQLILDQALTILELSDTPAHRLNVKIARQKLTDHLSKQNIVDNRKR